MDWVRIGELLKQYGPLVGLLLVIVLYQSFQINRLLDRLRSVQDDEIKRLADVQDRLLTALIGPQSSSATAPDVKKLADGNRQPTDKNEGNAGKGTTSA